MSPLVLDAGALIALDRHHRALGGLLDQAVRDAVPVQVPVGCLAQVWREPARQSRLAAFMRTKVVALMELTSSDAREIGLLLARAGGSDIVDAHVALCTLRAHGRVITSDPTDLARYLPPNRIVAI